LGFVEFFVLNLKRIQGFAKKKGIQ
jgi:hypothetical protein